MKPHATSSRLSSQILGAGPEDGLVLDLDWWEAGLMQWRGGKLLRRRAHRVAWELERGEIPGDLCVLHRCDVRLCVNPDHLFLGTMADNVADMDAKNRRCVGERHPKAKLSNAQVAEILALSWQISSNVLARRYGVSDVVIQSIWHRRHRKKG